MKKGSFEVFSVLALIIGVPVTLGILHLLESTHAPSPARDKTPATRPPQVIEGFESSHARVPGPATNDFKTEGPLSPVAAASLPALSPPEELKTIQLPDGYRLELVLSEPQIAEPVLCTFDGNGRMYVAEMRSYMQDIEGTGQFDPVSRISRHSSSKADGVFDKSEVFLDRILLPRMVLPMDDRVLVGLTNSNNFTLHRDINGDGRADESSAWFNGGPFYGNVQHQPSGLVWALDNWIYTTFNNYRLRWNGSGEPLEEVTAANGGQWGLAQDDHGKLWWSSAGGEKGIWNYQTPVLYGAINVASQMSPDFNKVWPLVALGDLQGGPIRFQSPEVHALNVFTASCGQTVFRGDRLPAELRGNVFLPEPAGRLIRRATVKVEDGITKVANPHGQGEFLRSSDPYFRPVNCTTGPDGCLYIVDMYRGIMDERAFTRRGSWLRERILEHGLDKVTSHGRIWRLVHKDFQPGPKPRMLDETPAQWVAHLAHPNGWWRDTAQRLLVLKGDRSVLPALRGMATSHADPLARIHALWSIEGLGALDDRLAGETLRDPQPDVRIQAIRASETILKIPGDHRELLAAIRGLAKDSDPNVVLQLMMSSKILKLPNWKADARMIVASSNSAGVREIGVQLLTEDPNPTGDYTPQQRSSIERGHQIFSSLCFSCHGSAGEGTPMAGSPDRRLAPPLKGSLTAVQGDSLLRVLLHGLTGPVEGKTYDSGMLAMGENSDSWIADVASYVRISFGNEGTPVTAQEVAHLRAATSSRALPWTIPELRAPYPQIIAKRSDWKLDASKNADKAALAIDGSVATRWSTGVEPNPTVWLRIELPAEEKLAGIILEHERSPRDFPARLRVEVSTDGITWTQAIETSGAPARSEIHFPEVRNGRFVRITRTAIAGSNSWSIHELLLLHMNS